MFFYSNGFLVQDHLVAGVIPLTKRMLQLLSIAQSRGMSNLGTADAWLRQQQHLATIGPGEQGGYLRLPLAELLAAQSLSYTEFWLQGRGVVLDAQMLLAVAKHTKQRVPTDLLAVLQKGSLVINKYTLEYLHNKGLLGDWDLVALPDLVQHGVYLNAVALSAAMASPYNQVSLGESMPAELVQFLSTKGLYQKHVPTRPTDLFRAVDEFQTLGSAIAHLPEGPLLAQQASLGPKLKTSSTGPVTPEFLLYLTDTGSLTWHLDEYAVQGLVRLDKQFELNANI